MRSRKLLTILVAVTPLFAAAPTAAVAAQHRGPDGKCRVTINVAPSEITAGDPVVIFGRLRCPNHAGRLIRLFHHLAGTPGFSLVQSTTTDANGFYEFSRADGKVQTNRSWFVRSRGARSATRAIRVAAQVTLNGPQEAQLQTGPAHAVTFTGTVDPADVGARVILQRQNASDGDGWVRIDAGRVAPGGTYSISHAFLVAGDANLRALVRSQGRNVPSPSNVLEYEISQAQNPALTIASSSDPISFGESVVISGTLASGALKPVTLLARVSGGAFAPVAQATTGGGGNYTFPAQMPMHSTFYRVTGAGQKSAVLYEGVRDVLTASASSTTVTAGQTITFTGTVAPDHSGHVIYLERRDLDHPQFHVVQVARVRGGSSFSITHRFFDAGSDAYRVFIPGGRENGGASSPTFSITVTPAPASSLTPEAAGNSSLPSAGGQ